MLKKFGEIALMIALAATPVCLAPMQGRAQDDARQRAYQAGYENGVNDREQNKSLNLKTDKWHGENLDAYEKGYENGYRNIGREYNESHSMSGAPGGDEERAYQAGYQNGMNDREQNKPLNLKTDKWHGENLEAYEKGYQDGYQHRH